MTKNIIVQHNVLIKVLPDKPNPLYFTMLLTANVNHSFSMIKLYKTNNFYWCYQFGIVQPVQIFLFYGIDMGAVNIFLKKQ